MGKKDRDILDEALARGVITGAQRKELAAIAAEERTDSEERIKPVGTFNEIFVTIGVFFALNAATGLVGLILHHAGHTAILSAVLAWLTAMYFDRGKRFRLPIVYACISAAIAVGMSVNFDSDGDVQGLFSNAPLGTTIITLTAALAVLAAGAWRFRVPFLMLPIGILFTAIITYAARHADDTISLRLLLGACGLVILATAVRFDLQDPRRITRWSDYAFWSYVVGSPLFVHSLFLSALLESDKEFMIHGPGWLGIAVLAIAVSFAGVLLNRRALIVSTLLYVGFVIFRLLSVLGSTGTMLLVTLLLIGLYVISLGSRWTQARKYVMSRLPSWKWLKQLPPY